MGEWEEILNELSENDNSHGGFIRQALEEIKQLRNELEALTAERDALNACIERELSDADKLTAAMGLTLEESRTEGGSLKVRRVINYYKETVDALAQATEFGATMSDKYVKAQARLAELEKQEAVAYIERITGRLALPDDNHRTKFPMAYEPLYTAPKPSPTTEAAVAMALQKVVKVCEETIKKYRCNTMVDDDGDPYPLVDALTPEGAKSVASGKEEIEHLVDAVCGEILAIPHNDSGVKKLVEALENECGGRCNAEYNPCAARQALKEFEEGK